MWRGGNGLYGEDGTKQGEEEGEGGEKRKANF
jgi:hypothetical protein